MCVSGGTVLMCALQEGGAVYHSPHYVAGTVGTVAGNRAKGQPGDSL